MFSEKNRPYISWGVTAFSVIVAALLVSFLINRFGEVSRFFASITKILMPVIYGFVMSFLMAPTYNAITGTLSGMISGETAADRKRWSSLSAEEQERRRKFGGMVARSVATLLCVIIILAILTALIAMLIPQLIQGVRELIRNLPENATSVSAVIHSSFFGGDEEMESMVLSIYDQIYSTLDNWITSDFMPNLNKYISQMTDGVVKILAVLKNFFIGLIVMAYGLNMKDLLSAQTKKMIYAFFPIRVANDIITEARFVKSVFSNFIVGKIIDSVIIGIICYICMSFMRMPYTLLISVFVGVTNVIPFFGPFIGAIPSALILLMTSPFYVLQFCIFILILQQFDGNILGPRILGSTTGVSSFWVLFSILFFGGMWGIVGMVVGIPTFAVITRLAERLIRHSLARRKLPVETEHYAELDSIEKESLEFQYREKL